MSTLRIAALAILYDTSACQVIRSNVRVLLQHRSLNAKRLPDHWGFFGGGVEPGETPEQALERELLEELEYTVSDYERIFVNGFDENGVQNVEHVFLARYDPSQKLTLHEGQGYGWFLPVSTSTLRMCPRDYETLRNASGFIADRLGLIPTEAPRMR